MHKKGLILALSLLLLASPGCLGQDLRGTELRNTDVPQPPNVEAPGAPPSPQTIIDKTIAKVKALEDAHPKLTKGIKRFNRFIVFVAPYVTPVLVGILKG